MTPQAQAHPLKPEIDRIEAQCDERHTSYSRRLLKLEKREAILWGDAASGQGGKLAAIDEKLASNSEDLASIKNSLASINIKIAVLVALVSVAVQAAFHFLPGGST